MLDDEKEATCCGGQLILLSGSRLEMNLVIDEERRHDLTVHTIAFPSRQTTLIDLGLGVVNGLQLAVDDDQHEDGGRLQSLTQSRLVAAFLQILRYDQQDTPTQVNTHTQKKGPICRGLPLS